MAIKGWLVGIILGICMSIYVLVGGAIFYAIENPREKENIQLSNTHFASFIGECYNPI